MYTIINSEYMGQTHINIKKINDDGSTTIFILNPDNTDYQQFKIDIAAGAELKDANNNVMTAEQANTFLATLP